MDEPEETPELGRDFTERADEVATGRPGEDTHFQEAAEEAARRETEGAAGTAGAGDRAGSSPVGSGGGGEPATSSSDEEPG
jgi:hypothetical protein